MVVKTCANCKHEMKWTNNEPCNLCLPRIGYDYWEPKDTEDVMPDGK